MPNAMVSYGVLCLLPGGTYLLNSIITELQFYGKWTLHAWLFEFWKGNRNHTSFKMHVFTLISQVMYLKAEMLSVVLEEG